MKQVGEILRQAFSKMVVLKKKEGTVPYMV